MKLALFKKHNEVVEFIRPYWNKGYTFKIERINGYWYAGIKK